MSTPLSKAWLAVAACIAAVLSQSAAAKSVTHDLAGFQALDVATDVDKASVEWTVTRDGEPGSGVQLVVEGTSLLGSSLTPDTENSKKAVLTLNCTCTASGRKPPIGPGGASGAKAASTSLPLTVAILFALGLIKVNRATWLALIILAIACLCINASGSCICGPGIKLTLVLEAYQVGGVDQCGMCQQDFALQHKQFRWQLPCDVQSAAKTLDKVGASCNESLGAKPPCDALFFSPTPQCTLPAGSYLDLCMNRELSSALLNVINASGTAFLNNYFECRPEAVEGRPYTTGNGSLRASAHWHSHDCPWSELSSQRQASQDSISARESLAHPPEGWDEAEAVNAAEEWLRHGQDEHASIASFSRFSLDLLRFAAPPSLIEAAHAAAIDEVRHAKLAFNLAAHFRGRLQDGNVHIGAFPASSVDLSESISVVAWRTFQEGCVGESSAVARLVFALTSLKVGSPARAVLKELLEDEARHAALAWATLHWSFRSGAEVVSSEDGAGQEPEIVESSSVPLSLAWGGRVPELVSMKVGALVQAAWVQPWKLALSTGRPLTSTVIVPAGQYGEAVSQAAQLVYKEFAKLQGLHQGQEVV